MSIFNKRASGILLHITSLPSIFGTGDLGPQAYFFIDFLKSAGQSCWQILPLNPVSSQKKYSPYASYSAFGANTLLISPEKLYTDGFLNKKDFEDAGLPGALEGCANSLHGSSKQYCFTDYKKASLLKTFLLGRAYSNFCRHTGKYKNGFEEFIQSNDSMWLKNHAMFSAFYNYFSQKIKVASWARWPVAIRNNIKKETGLLAKKLEDEIRKEKFFQYLFYSQWESLKNYANSKSVKIIGDLPIYIDFNSADAWSRPEIFKLDNRGLPAFLAGVPPDYFSSTGQLWKNPVYDWEELKKQGFAWWIKRMEHNFRLFDLVRIDHFRGFIAYWEVPSSCRTAENGKWVKAYPYEFFGTLKDKYKDLPVIAENLGVITEDVEEVMKYFGFPGIKVLQFAFGSGYPHGSNLPGNFSRENVVYTGTHDNNTVKGWYQKEALDIEKKNIENYVSGPVDADSVSDVFIKIAMSSDATLAVIPIQDFSGLGEKARMNRPATTSGNWLWQAHPEMFSESAAGKILAITTINGRD